VWKRHQGKTTKWIWDGNVPVHEWVELDPGVTAEPAPEKVSEAEDAGSANALSTWPSDLRRGHRPRRR
jgi:hypothetical protein